MIRCYTFALIGILFPIAAFGQGQDSHPAERDLAVIDEMMSGLYVNANQNYFEGRLNVAEDRRHPKIEMEIVRGDSTAGFRIVIVPAEGQAKEFDAVLSANVKQGHVSMRITEADADKSKPVRCDYAWEREAMQFRAKVSGQCDSALPTGFVLSQQQFWIYPSPDADLGSDNPYKLHRARRFSCYADMPGVGGGRDIPYERYDGIELHDQGGEVWFDTRETPSRRMSLSMFLVDWPINNYEGIFTRDSLVVYVNEELDGERKEHGYAFTEAGAKRIGINLKWILASCFMESNAEATPFM